MRLKTTLALDLGTKTGWALVHNNKITSGTCVHEHTRFEGAGMRYVKFGSWLDKMHELTSIELVYFESVAFLGKRNNVAVAQVYGAFLGTLTAWCEVNKIPYEGVPVSHIKKFVTGKGNASKDEVIKAVKAAGFDPKDDNEADALALLCMKCKEMV